MFHVDFSIFFTPSRMTWGDTLYSSADRQKEEVELQILKNTVAVCPACKKIMDLQCKDTVVGHGETAVGFSYKCSCGMRTRTEYGRSCREQIIALHKLNKIINKE